MIFYILSIATWAGLIIWLFWCLRKRLRRLQEENDKIYQDELKARQKASKSRYECFYKFDVETEEEAMKNRASDDIESGHMIF